MQSMYVKVVKILKSFGGISSVIDTTLKVYCVSRNLKVCPSLANPIYSLIAFIISLHQTISELCIITNYYAAIHCKAQSTISPHVTYAAQNTANAPKQEGLISFSIPNPVILYAIIL